MAQRRLVLVREDCLGHGSNSGTKRLMLSASVPGDIASPMSARQAATRHSGRRQTNRS